MIKILLGGSPCTFWSIAQKNCRETKAEGIGWELFNNYLIAKEKFKPDIFLYENNKSASTEIKTQIKEELNVYRGDLFSTDSGSRYIEIDSALVSAQSRKRFYVHNCGDVEQPSDRGILLRDILETDGFDLTGNDKTYALTASYGGAVPWNTIERHQRNMIAEPIRVGSLPRPNGELSTSQAMRIYSIDGKSTTLSAGGGGLGGKTGLYAVPTAENGKTIYVVEDGKICIRGTWYPTKLENGLYNIRKLSITECCRLQTLPDNYCRAVSKAQAYRGLGNGWTAEVIIHILRNALCGINRDELIVVLSMYDGISTGRYCLQQLGFNNVEYYASEIDGYAMTVSKSNYPDIVQIGDAFAVRNSDWKIK